MGPDLGAGILDVLHSRSLPDSLLCSMVIMDADRGLFVPSAAAYACRMPVTAHLLTLGLRPAHSEN